MAAVISEDTVVVTNDADVMAARASARRMAASMGFDAESGAEIETVVSELAGNLVAHGAIAGTVNFGRIGSGGASGLEIRVDDQGPGIRDLESAMRDGESTNGTLGIGLSGAKRLMDEFSIESAWGAGTHITARKWLGRKRVATMDFSVCQRPKPGERISGDAYLIRRLPSSILLAVIDGLGHGTGANEAALAAVGTVESGLADPLDELMRACHNRLRNTRGAAVALCRVEVARGVMQHLSVGNVETRVYGSPTPVRPYCFNGTVGGTVRRFRMMEYPFSCGSTIVMFTDGVSGRFELAPHELRKAPQEIARLIFDGYARQTDDATVLVGR